MWDASVVLRSGLSRQYVTLSSMQRGDRKPPWALCWIRKTLYAYCEDDRCSEVMTESRCCYCCLPWPGAAAALALLPGCIAAVMEAKHGRLLFLDGLIALLDELRLHVAVLALDVLTNTLHLRLGAKANCSSEGCSCSKTLSCEWLDILDSQAGLPTGTRSGRPTFLKQRTVQMYR